VVTVGELRASLSGVGDDVDVALVAFDREGIYLDGRDVSLSGVELDDTRGVAVLWLVGHEVCLVAPPIVLTSPCSCGAQLTIEMAGGDWLDDGTDQDHTAHRSRG
jgi:hypothetical protein